MGSRDAFKDREKAMEKAYFSAQDTKLLDELRARAVLGDVAIALKEKLQVDNVELLEEIEKLGITEDTGAALLMAPLVQVAWSDGRVSARERRAVLEVAASRGVEADSPAHAKLVEWLDTRPPDQLFETALKTIHAGLSVLPPEEHREREQRVAAACKHVALASGGLGEFFGLGGEISKTEQGLIDAIAERVHAKGQGGA